MSRRQRTSRINGRLGVGSPPTQFTFNDTVCLALIIAATSSGAMVTPFSGY
ncbi:MAG: hypothetical protein QXJ27_02805 [Thermoplasmata archaeon]